MLYLVYACAGSAAQVGRFTQAWSVLGENLPGRFSQKIVKKRKRVSVFDELKMCILDVQSSFPRTLVCRQIHIFLENLDLKKKDHVHD